MWGFVIVALILAIAIPLAIAHNKKTNLAWSDAARTLGLTYRPGGFLQSRRIEGRLKELRVVVDTFSRSSGKHSTSYTRYRVDFPRSLGLGLQLRREGMFSSVSKFFGSQDIKVGDASFDNSMLVKGHNVHGIREFLTPARRLRIQRFITSRQEAVIDDSSIRYTKVGIVSKSSALVSAIQSMAQLGWLLIEQREQDSQLQRAMQLQNEGDPESALRCLEAATRDTAAVATPGERFLENPIDEKRLQGELLYLSGDREQAHKTFQDVQHADPDDEEVGDWLDLTKETPEPTTTPEAVASSDAVMSAEPPVDQPVAQSGASETEDVTDAKVSVERDQFCDDLFAEDVRSFDVNTLFEERYQGRKVNWSGELTKVERNYSSFIFDQSGGTKVTFKIDERPSPYYGTQDVLAVVHLSEAEGEQLKHRIGQTIRFSGELVKADGLMRNVYLDHGEMT